jgi:small GTP-binding protein
MARTQKNKATSYHLGLLKAKIAKLKREMFVPSKGAGGGAGEGFEVSKSGDARVGMIGFPSVGKSTLLSNLTGTESEVAAYEFTTLTCIPGVLDVKGTKVQLLDLPGIIEGAKDGKGRGKQVIAVARTCNLILLVLDVAKPMKHMKIIENELEGFGIRLNKTPPNITIRKHDKGGIKVSSTHSGNDLSIEEIKAVCSEYRITNAEITIRCEATIDDVIDVIEGNRVYIPCIYVLNKIDQISVEELELLMKVQHAVPVSGHHKWNFDELLDKMWDYLHVVRVYTKPKGKSPDYNEPVVMKATNPTVEQFCLRLHKTLLNEFKYALVWGASAKHTPQRVGKEHILCDEDIIQIVKKI